MGTFKSVEEAKEHFKKDKFATENGMSLDELTEEYAVASMEISERHQNAYGGIMGGAIFTLADLAFAALANHHHKLTVALQVSINYLSAPKGKKLTAKATCRKNGRTTGVYVIDVTDDTGRDVAQFVGTGYKL